MKCSSYIVWIFASASALSLMAGCSQNAVRWKMTGSAPALGEGQAHIRGVSDPNAPFTLVVRTKAAAIAPGDAGDAAAGLCRASDLQVYEAAASMNGEMRVVRLALKNNAATACRLSGYPAIELEDDRGSAIASIIVRQTGRATLAGTVAAPAEDVASKPGSAVDVVLPGAGEASFEIGWSSGDGCPLVSRFTVALPAKRSGTGPRELGGEFTINHALNVCDGQMLVTALRADGSV